MEDEAGAEPDEGVNSLADIHLRHWQFRDRLPMWVVFRPTTTDFPGYWGARMRLTIPRDEPTRLVILSDTLEGVRAALPHGLVRLLRDEADDPVIEEVWL